MIRFRPLVFDAIAFVLLAPLYAMLGFMVYLYWQNQSTPSTRMDAPHLQGVPPCTADDLNKCFIATLRPGDVVRVEYIVNRRRACTLKIARILEDVGGVYDKREHQIDYTEQTFGAEQSDRPSGYNFEVPKTLPDDPHIQCQKYDIFSRVQYFCNELDKWLPRFMMTDGKRETRRVRVEVCR